jgi:hypothetical protein
VADDDNLEPMVPHINYGDPMINMDVGIMSRILTIKHDSTFKPSSILLTGVFIFLLLFMATSYDWALLTLLVSVILADYFQYYRKRNTRI